MKLTMRAKELSKKISLITTAFVLAVSTLTAAVPFVLAQRVDAAPLAINTTASGFNTYAWTKDRTQPFAYSKVQDKLTFTVDTTVTSAPNATTFYKYEGFNSNPSATPFPANTSSVKASLYIDPAWQTRPASVSMWGQATSNGTDTAWPMLGFANSFEQNYVYAPGDDAFVGFRVYNTFTGQWTNVLPAGALWGTTVDLEISSNPNTGNFEFFVNGTKVAEYAHYGYDALKGVIFNNVNVKDNIAANKYYVKWTDLQTGRVTPDGSVDNVRLVRDGGTPIASGSSVNFSDVKLYWDTVEEAARYRVTVTHPDGSSTNFQPSTNASWNPDSISFNLSDAVRNGLFGSDAGDKGEGAYTYTVAVQLGGVWSAESAPVALTFDKTKATTQVLSPSNNAVLNGGNLQVKFADAGGLKTAVTHLYTAADAQVGTIWETFNATGETEVVRSFSLNSLPEGTYYVKANATDAAGNGTGNTVTSYFTLDKTNPTIEVKAGYVGDATTKVFSNVSFKLKDNLRIDYLEVNGTRLERTNAPVSDANFANIKAHLNQGAANQVVLYDEAGNATTYEFTYDTQLPTATFTYSHGNNLTNQGALVTLTASEAVQDIADWTRTGAYTFTKPFSTNGKFTVALTDVAGNNGTAKGEVKRIDMVTPVFLNVTDGAFVTTAPFVIQVQDPYNGGAHGIVEKLIVDGEEVTLTHTGDFVYEATITGEGSHTVVVKDKAGNEDEITFIIDTVAPSVEILTRSANLVTGTADPDAMVVLTIDGEASEPFAPNADGTWSYTIAPRLGAGTHTFSATASDEAGNSSEAAAVPSLTVLAVTPTVVPLQTANPAPAPEAQTFNGPAFVSPAAQQEVLGEDTDEADNSGVEGTSTEKNLAAAIDGDNTDGNALGLAWYWWLLIIAGGATGIWWLIAALRGRSAE